MAKWSWPWSRKAGVRDSLELWKEILGGREAFTGRSITIDDALRVSTVFSICRVLGDGVAQVPLKLYRESADGKSRQPAKDHGLYHLLHRRPNEFQTSFEFRETMVMQLVLCGAFFAYKVRGLGNEIRELLPLEPGRVTVKQNADWTLTYTLRGKNGQEQEIPAADIWHVRGPSLNGWLALDCVQLAREALGLAIALEESHGRLHKNGAKTGGLISVDGKLSAEQYKDLRKWITENFEGSANAYRTAIMDNGAKWTPASMTGVDAEHLATRRNQVEELCRFWRVMPIMVGFSDKSVTYASAEQMFLAHVVHTLAPWYERLEQSIDCNLLTPQDAKNGVYAKFTEEGLLRGSLEVTKNYLLGLVNGGVMTPNEGRAKLDLNPDADPASDKLRVPANITGAAKPSGKQDTTTTV